MLPTAVLAASLSLELVQQLSHHHRLPLQVLHPHPQGLQLVPMEPVVEQPPIHVKDQLMGCVLLDLHINIR